VPIAVIAALLIKSFVFQAFYIPSGSMQPTLQIGDRVLVNKLSYDLHDVHRGDIVVFEAPASARTDGIKDLVKRVIGLPGDTVTYAGGSVLINGRRLEEPYLPTGTTTQALDGANTPPRCGSPPDGQPGCVVPKGRLFVMGDNRGASKDARVFGPIRESTIVGRVFVRIWPLDTVDFF
jgi:signal peptidase I